MKRKALYIGRRFIKGNLFYVFINESKKNLFFKGLKQVLIGHTYHLEDDGTIKATPDLLDDDRVDNPEWEAQDVLSINHYYEKRAEEKAKKKLEKMSQPFIRAAVEALEPLAFNLSDYEIKSLALYLLKEISARKRKKK